ncbi:rhodanese-related sulfurtransferase [Kineosphaera limosa]|uniref:Rhodanese domain-containing protein n=1 Tax=Kineosphaera limosa NBRC 100340 TaxID=1184609 RepID=K6W6S0_9MICO|nr:rhodanese-like domain-containing protein [Kineosphaera limosa]NYE00925.1 rhodanese-related sulfurtransferase [Kineosphaera limosa]GAB94880.1 hypothetical protein KILIM_014_00150 [Kineosphaera limosa NBRC 100340]
MREVPLDALIEAHPLGATVLDVREQQEYLSGHVPGAIHIPMGEVPARLQDVPHAQPLYVICASGGRSQVSAAQLEAAGYEAVSVQEGTKGWIARGQAVVTGGSPN